MHPVSLGLRSDVCTWHWLWGRWKVCGSETSAFTLFHQLSVSSKVKPDLGEERAQVSGKWTREGLTEQPIIVKEICVEILPVLAHVLACTLENTFIEKRKLLCPYSQFIPFKCRYKLHKGPDHGISQSRQRVIQGHCSLTITALETEMTGIFLSVPEPHPYRSPRKWFLWALWISSHPCRSSDYKSRPRAGLDGSTSSWTTATKRRNNIQLWITGKQNAISTLAFCQ